MDGEAEGSGYRYTAYGLFMESIELQGRLRFYLLPHAPSTIMGRLERQSGETNSMYHWYALADLTKKEALAAAIEFAAHQRSIAPEELAKRVNCHLQTILRYFAGTTSPSKTRLAELADALGTSVADIQGLADQFAAHKGING